MDEDDYACPACGGACDRDEVDIGVGVLCGPWGCSCCGWVEGYPIVTRIEDSSVSSAESTPKCECGSLDPCPLHDH